MTNKQGLKKISYIPILDGLRGFAVILVLLGHLPRVGDNVFSTIIWKIPQFLHFAFMGVDIFFCLSGFLITRILLHSLEKGTFSFKNFWIKRIFRIFPIYYLTVFLVYFFIDKSHIQSLLFYYSNFDFAFNKDIHPMRHTWSLAVEEHYYLFVPIIIYFLSKRFLLKFFLYIIPVFVLSQVIYLALYHPYDIKILDKISSIRFLTLGFGSFLALKEAELKKFTKYKKTAYFIILFLFIAGPLLRFLNLPVFYIIGRFIFSGIISILFLSILVSNHYFNKNCITQDFFSSRVLKFFGKISYGIYLYHLPILFLFGVSHMQNYEFVSLSKFILILSTIIIVSMISYEIIEKPMLKLKSYLNL